MYSGEGNGHPLQFYCLENPMDRGAQWAAVLGVTKSWTQLNNNSKCTQWNIIQPKPERKSCHFLQCEWNLKVLC